MTVCLKIIFNLIAFDIILFLIYAQYGLAYNSRYLGIVGGEPTLIEDFPYLVSVWKNGTLHCGGAIINHEYVLTAAHCVRKRPKSLYSVLVRTTDLHNGNGERYNIEKIISHRRYRQNGDYDISVLKIDGTFIFGDKVARARLPDRRTDFNEGTVFNVTGWGDIQWGGSKPGILMRTVVPWVNQTVCKREYEGAAIITPRVFCAGSEGHDACQGDSGDPLSLEGLVVGIVSRGKFCGWGEYPSIYTKVSKFRTWIRKAAKMTNE